MITWCHATSTPRSQLLNQPREQLLATTSTGSVDWVWNIKPGVKYAKGWGEVTSTDVKFTMTEHLKEGTVNANRRAFGQWYGANPNNLDFSDPLVLKLHQLEKFNLPPPSFQSTRCSV